LNSKLAIDGGVKSLNYELKTYTWIDEQTISMASDLMRTQKLSDFLGQPGDSYLGGQWVRKLESAVADFGGHRFAISFNSWTSGLEAIFLSLDLPAESEVLVPTWTMSATISSIVNAGLIPVFVDIDLNNFTILLEDLESKVSENTSAICSVDLFGKPAPLVELRTFAARFGLSLVTDSAQCPAARINGVSPSRIADVGGYSLNRHKHFQSGEGGIVVTEDEVIAERLQALRNHGEVASPKTQFSNSHIYGHNWRLGEIEALIAYRQYLDAERIVGDRRNIGKLLARELSSIPGLTVPEYDLEHDYYILGMVLQDGSDREFIASALRAEGISILVTRYSGLEDLPAFKSFNTAKLVNSKKLNDESFIGLYLAGHAYSQEDISNISNAFKKVFQDSRSKK
jgi:dTDP-4-amino-4,6-dideoxygalactose transaminase